MDLATERLSLLDSCRRWIRSRCYFCNCATIICTHLPIFLGGRGSLGPSSFVAISSHLDICTICLNPSRLIGGQNDPRQKSCCPFHQEFKCKSLFSLLNIGVNTYLLSQWHILPVICAAGTQIIFSLISHPSAMLCLIHWEIRDTRYISQISENTRYIFQNTKYIVPVAYFASHLILCCWHTNHLLLYPWNLRRKPFGFSESADCED